MKKIIFLLLSIVSLRLNAQISFNSMSLEANHRGYFATAISDMNHDYLDDIIRVSFYGDISIAFQQSNGEFNIVLVDSVDYISTDFGSWSICIADVNNDTYNDIFVGNKGKQFLFNSNGSSVSFTRTQLDSTFFAQTANFIDIDIDGDLDLFVCNDDSSNYVYSNDGNGVFAIDTSILHTLKWGGNYGSVWSDYDNDNDLDLYLAKCRGGVTDSTDPGRVNLLYRNDNGVYNEVAALANVDDGAQSWCSDFGDIDNDGDFDLIVANHYSPHKLFENNGDGTFTKITTQAGIDEYDNAGVFQSLFVDLDNDGWLDLIMATEDNGKIIYQNDGDGTFTLVQNPLDSNKLYSISLGDLNNDGFTDMYSIRKNQIPNIYDDEVHFNTGNSYNYLGLTVLNYNFPAAIGTKLKLYGNWGVQTKEIRAGESYGIHNSFQKIFGLANEMQFDSLVIGGCKYTSVPNINAKYVVDLANCSLTEIDFTDNVSNGIDNEITIYANDKKIYLISEIEINKEQIFIYGIDGKHIPFDLKNKVIYPKTKSNLLMVNINEQAFKIKL